MTDRNISMKSIGIVMGYRMGGIFSVYKILAPELAKTFDIKTLTMDNHLRQGTIEGIQEIDLCVKSPLKGIRILIFLLQFVRKSKLNNLKYFIINNQGVGILVYIASLCFNFRYIIHQHSPIEESISNKSNVFLKKLYIFFLINTFRKADYIICNSRYIEENIINSLKLTNTRVIYNPIDISKIIEGAERTDGIKYDKANFNFLSVGRLSRAKGYDVLIKAVNKVRMHINNAFKVFIIGDGEEHDALNNLIEKYDLHNYVVLCGFKKEPYADIKNCDCYLSTSLWEGFGITIAYAMILKKPIIASRTGGAIEILNKENAFCNISDDDDLSNKMISMILNKKTNEAIVTANYEKALGFDYKHVAGQFRLLLEE